ncbi:MAG: hypothetical protein KUG65_03190 [Sphingomonadaceae bacterium]|nr:hypothetical protein [Sphingomonadaceae bacterium]
MTETTRTPFPLARIALVLAALAAVITIGFAISRSQNEAPEDIMAPAPEGTIAALEASAEANPDNAAAWQSLGFARFNAGKYATAASAYGKAARIDPAQAVLWSALGEALVMASERDPMPGDALAAFRKAAAIDRQDPRARYFLAVEKDLKGDHDGALTDWLALLADTPKDAPWRADLIRTIEQVGKINDINVTQRLASAGARSPAGRAPVSTRAIPGPGAQDLAAASAIPPGEQRKMAESMVTRLEKRLAGDPANVDGWVMLMRSRMMLGQPARARKALADALAANPGKAAALRQQAEMLGIEN